MSKPTFAADSIHLGATLIAQAAGDVGKARRAATHAARWLESVDPDHKPTPAADDGTADEALALADAFRAECDALKAQRAELDALLKQHDSTLEAIEAALPDALVRRAGGSLAEAVRILVDVADKLRKQVAAPVPAPAPLKVADAPKVAPVAPVAPAPVQAPEDGMVAEDDPRIPNHIKNNRALWLFQRKRLWKADRDAANAID